MSHPNNSGCECGICREWHQSHGVRPTQPTNNDYQLIIDKLETMDTKLNSVLKLLVAFARVAGTLHE